MQLLRAEFTKAITLPSIMLAALSALLVPPFLALVRGMNFRPSGEWGSSVPIESHGFEVAGFGQPFVILLAALLAGTEFVDHQVRTTLTAEPKRGRVVAAKLTIVASSAVIVGLIAISAAVVLEHLTLGEYGLAFSEFTTGMAWNLGGVVLNYTWIALIAAALTILTRSFVVTLIVLIPMVLGLTLGLVQTIPALKYLPDLAGIQLLTAYPGSGLLEPLLGALVMGAWALALMVTAAVMFSRRDTNG